MKCKKLFFKECHLAGAKYHDLDEVLEELKIGTVLQLVHESDNRYDPNAVAVVYTDGEGDEYMIGYIPRDENSELAVLLEMGWGNIFKCTVSRINPEAYYEDQIHLKISILKNENA